MKLLHPLLIITFFTNKLLKCFARAQKFFVHCQRRASSYFLWLLKPHKRLRRC